MPHEGDTDDLSIEDGDTSGYNHHHSKVWNKVVDQKASELQNIMENEEKKVLAEKKAKEEAEKRA